jgi:urease accessory protein
MIAAASLLSLLQLASPSLPIGAYSYSQGLESAIAAGHVHDPVSAQHWIAAQLEEVIARFDAPVQWRLLLAYAARDAEAAGYWSERALAARDTAEFRAETVQMGYSLAQLLAGLLRDRHEYDTRPLAILRDQAEPILPASYACAVATFHVPPDAALLAMLFSWVENQVLVCVKSVPLGQVAGQRLLLALAPIVEEVAAQARAMPDHELSSWSPGLSLMSMRHETQYSRLYRS